MSARIQQTCSVIRNNASCYGNANANAI